MGRHDTFLGRKAKVNPMVKKESIIREPKDHLGTWWKYILALD